MVKIILPELYDYLKTIYDINKDVTLSIYNVDTPTGAKGIDLIDADDFTFDYLKQELTF